MGFASSVLLIAITILANLCLLTVKVRDSYLLRTENSNNLNMVREIIEQQQIFSRQTIELVAIIGVVLDIAIIWYIVYTVAKKVLGTFTNILSWFIGFAFKLIILVGCVYGLYHLSQGYLNEVSRVYIKDFVANITTKLVPQ